MVKDTLNNISYGLFILSAKTDDKDNACIINTFAQLTSNPLQFSITVNKDNFTCKQIMQSKVCNISILDDRTNFDLIKRFGFCSGVDTNKFDLFDGAGRAENGVLYVSERTNAYVSLAITQMIDVGTHIHFIADGVAGEKLSNNKSLTYFDYHNSVKPKRESRPSDSAQEVWKCDICGYEHTGALPQDFVCPLCKHGAVDFKKI